MNRRSGEPTPKYRKLSSKLETITVPLSQEEIDAQRALVCELRDKQDELENKLETIKADFKGRAKELEQAEAVARRLVSTKKQDIEVMVEECLIDGHDGVMVQKFRADTGELIGAPRRATANEKQEVLPLDGGFGS